MLGRCASRFPLTSLPRSAPWYLPAERRLPITDRAPDPGLFGPSSVTWRVMAEPVLMLGAGRALLMQAAHPLVAEGAIEHSTYRSDPYGRFERTVEWVTVVCFGTTAEARERVPQRQPPAQRGRGAAQASTCHGGGPQRRRLQRPRRRAPALGAGDLRRHHAGGPRRLRRRPRRSGPRPVRARMARGRRPDGRCPRALALADPVPSSASTWRHSWTPPRAAAVPGAGSRLVAETVLHPPVHVGGDAARVGRGDLHHGRAPARVDAARVRHPVDAGPRRRSPRDLALVARHPRGGASAPQGVTGARPRHGPGGGPASRPAQAAATSPRRMPPGIAIPRMRLH